MITVSGPIGSVTCVAVQAVNPVAGEQGSRGGSVPFLSELPGRLAFCMRIVRFSGAVAVRFVRPRPFLYLPGGRIERSFEMVRLSPPLPLGNDCLLAQARQAQIAGLTIAAGVLARSALEAHTRDLCEWYGLLSEQPELGRLRFADCVHRLYDRHILDRYRVHPARPQTLAKVLTDEQLVTELAAINPELGLVRVGSHARIWGLTQ